MGVSVVRRTHNPVRSLMSGLLALFMLASLSSAAQGQTGGLVLTDSEREAMLREGTVRYLMDEHAMTVEEAVLQLDLQTALAPVRERAVAAWSDVFAGLVLDHHNGDAVLMFSGQADAATADLLADFDYPDRIRVIDVDFSRRELTDRADTFATALSASLLLPKVRGISILEQLNAVTVLVEPGAQDAIGDLIVQLFDDLSGFTVVEYPGVPSGQTTPCSGATEYQQRRNCPDPLRGGIQMLRPGSECTIGFVARNPRGDKYVVSAGHCQNPANASIFYEHDGRRIGNVAASMVGGNTLATASNVDALRVFGGNDTWQVSRWVFADGNAQSSYQMRSRARKQQLVVGSVVCRSGITTNEVCGTILDTSARAVQLDGAVPKWYDDQLLTDTCIRPGDSGGPVYGPVDQRLVNDTLGVNYFATAIGLATTGVTEDESLPCGEATRVQIPLPPPLGSAYIEISDVTWSSHVRNVEARLDVTVVTN